jgi:copper ion binding protein
MAETDVRISGMSCQHCVMAVKKALGELEGVSGAEVEIGSTKVKYDESKVSKEEIEKAIVKAGYKIEG